MGAITKIAWCDHTFNPWMGCQRVSPGCEHCYAETLVTGRMGLPVWGPAKTTERKRTAESNWRKPLAWDRAAAKAGKPAKVFCASLADVFEDHPALAPWRADLFALIEKTPHLTWQLLTKRPENLRKMLPAAWLETPRPNVWLGCTVEDQQRAHARVPELLRVPAVVRFLSCEPLVESVSLDPAICEHCGSHESISNEGDVPWCTECDSEACFGHWLFADGVFGISWVIVGGESGVGARPFDLEWARDIVRECSYRGVPVFVKQFGANAVEERGECPATGDTEPGSHCGLDECAGGCRYAKRVTVPLALRDSHGGDLAEFPADLRVRKFPAVRA